MAMRRLAMALALALGTALAAPGCSAAGSSEGGGAAVAGKLENLSPAVLSARLAGGKVQLIDVRTAEEFQQGHIAGAINLPLDSFDPKAIPAEPGKELVLYCRSGRRSALAAGKMFENGSETVRHLEGGILAWQAAGLPVSQ